MSRDLDISIGPFLSLRNFITYPLYLESLRSSCSSVDTEFIPGGSLLLYDILAYVRDPFFQLENVVPGCIFFFLKLATLIK